MQYFKSKSPSTKSLDLLFNVSHSSDDGVFCAEDGDLSMPGGDNDSLGENAQLIATSTELPNEKVACKKRDGSESNIGVNEDGEFTIPSSGDHRATRAAAADDESVDDAGAIVETEFSVEDKDVENAIDDKSAADMREEKDEGVDNMVNDKSAADMREEKDEDVVDNMVNNKSADDMCEEKNEGVDNMVNDKSAADMCEEKDEDVVDNMVNNKSADDMCEEKDEDVVDNMVNDKSAADMCEEKDEDVVDNMVNDKSAADMCEEKNEDVVDKMVIHKSSADICEAKDEDVVDNTVNDKSAADMCEEKDEDVVDNMVNDKSAADMCEEKDEDVVDNMVNDKSTADMCEEKDENVDKMLNDKSADDTCEEKDDDIENIDDDKSADEMCEEKDEDVVDNMMNDKSTDDTCEEKDDIENIDDYKSADEMCEEKDDDVDNIVDDESENIDDYKSADEMCEEKDDDVDNIVNDESDADMCEEKDEDLDTIVDDESDTEMCEEKDEDVDNIVDDESDADMCEEKDEDIEKMVDERLYSGKYEENGDNVRRIIDKKLAAENSDNVENIFDVDQYEEISDNIKKNMEEKIANDFYKEGDLRESIVEEKLTEIYEKNEVDIKFQEIEMAAKQFEGKSIDTEGIIQEDLTNKHKKYKNDTNEIMQESSSSELNEKNRGNPEEGQSVYGEKVLMRSSAEYDDTRPTVNMEAFTIDGKPELINEFDIIDDFQNDTSRPTFDPSMETLIGDKKANNSLDESAALHGIPWLGSGRVNCEFGELLSPSAGESSFGGEVSGSPREKRAEPNVETLASGGGDVANWLDGVGDNGTPDVDDRKNDEGPRNEELCESKNTLEFCGSCRSAVPTVDVGGGRGIGLLEVQHSETAGMESVSAGTLPCDRECYREGKSPEALNGINEKNSDLFSDMSIPRNRGEPVKEETAGEEASVESCDVGVESRKQESLLAPTSVLPGGVDKPYCDAAADIARIVLKPKLDYPKQDALVLPAISTPKNLTGSRKLSAEQHSRKIQSIRSMSTSSAISRQHILLRKKDFGKGKMDRSSLSLPPIDQSKQLVTSKSVKKSQSSSKRSLKSKENLSSLLLKFSHRRDIAKSKMASSLQQKARRDMPQQKLQSDAFWKDGKLQVTVFGNEYLFPAVSKAKSNVKSLEVNLEKLPTQAMFTWKKCAVTQPVAVQKKMATDKDILETRASQPPFNTTMEGKTSWRHW